MGKWIRWIGQAERRRSRPNTQFNIKTKLWQQQKTKVETKQQ